MSASADNPQADARPASIASALRLSVATLGRCKPDKGYAMALALAILGLCALPLAAAQRAAVIGLFTVLLYMPRLLLALRQMHLSFVPDARRMSRWTFGLLIALGAIPTIALTLLLDAPVFDTAAWFITGFAIATALLAGTTAVAAILVVLAYLWMIYARNFYNTDSVEIRYDSELTPLAIVFSCAATLLMNVALESPAAMNQLRKYWRSRFAEWIKQPILVVLFVCSFWMQTIIDIFCVLVPTVFSWVFFFAPARERQERSQRLANIDVALLLSPLFAIWLLDAAAFRSFCTYWLGLAVPLRFTAIGWRLFVFFPHASQQSGAYSLLGAMAGTRSRPAGFGSALLRMLSARRDDEEAWANVLTLPKQLAPSRRRALAARMCLGPPIAPHRGWRWTPLPWLATTATLMLFADAITEYRIAWSVAFALAFGAAVLFYAMERYVSHLHRLEEIFGSRRTEMPELALLPMWGGAARRRALIRRALVFALVRDGALLLGALLLLALLVQLNGKGDVLWPVLVAATATHLTFAAAVFAAMQGIVVPDWAARLVAMGILIYGAVAGLWMAMAADFSALAMWLPPLAAIAWCLQRGRAAQAA